MRPSIPHNARHGFTVQHRPDTRLQKSRPASRTLYRRRNLGIIACLNLYQVVVYIIAICYYDCSS